MIKKILAAAGILSMSGLAFGLDKPALEVHLRKALNLDTNTPISVGDVAPANVGDLQLVQVTIGGGKYPVYMTKDEKKYIWGQVFDFTLDPDKERAKMISMKDVHSKGPVSARVTIVEFSDLQCPHCKEAHKTLNAELFKKYSDGQVRFVFKHFPLSGHDWAEPAAIGDECAGKQGDKAFWAMTDIIFKNAAVISTSTIHADLLSYAKDLNLKEAAFAECLEDPAILEKVKANKIEGMNAGVSSTPTLFINGRMRRGFRDFSEIAVVVDEKLKEAKGSLSPTQISK